MEYLKLLKIMEEIQNTLKLGFRPTQLLLASLVSLLLIKIMFSMTFYLKIFELYKILL